MGYKSKILIVDDAPSVLSFLSDILMPYYTVETASSGEEALEILLGFRPDMVLLDVIMTGLDGYEICRKIRANGSFGFIKIIMISVGTTLKERLRGYEAGADDYIGKPFDEEELLAKVRVFMRLKSVEDQLQELNDKLNEQIRVRSKQLLNAEKMAVIGKYAAGIVHNLNNPLQAIMGCAQLFAMKYPHNKDIMIIKKAADEMQNIITSILKTSQKESREDLVDIDLNQVLRDQIELLKANQFFKHRIRSEIKLNALPLYPGVYHHFSQSIGNLIKNAVEAMYDREKGVLSISSRKEGNAIIITISDTGDGIPQTDMGKIFDPFFTTKPIVASDGHPTGTGLGLVSCKEMIASYGGEIGVASESGKGTTFTVRLPMKK